MYHLVTATIAKDGLDFDGTASHQSRRLFHIIGDEAAGELGIQLTWKGQGVEEKAFDQQGRCVVEVDPRYFRPTEVETLLGDPSKAKEKLGWTPRIRFGELVSEMMREDLKAAERDELVKKHGFSAYDYHE